MEFAKKRPYQKIVKLPETFFEKKFHEACVKAAKRTREKTNVSMV